MDWPAIDVLIITYDRPVEIRRVIDALWTHLVYPGPILWHIADDASPAGYLEAIARDYPQIAFQATVTPRLGWGANVNKGLQSCESEFVFAIEDDYVAKVDLRLDIGVALMKAEPQVGLVRYDGLSGHVLDLALREAKTVCGTVQFLRIMKTSPDLNVYSHRPHLKSRTFHACYGSYPEGLSLAATEVQFAAHVREVMSPFAPQLVALENGIASAVDHIGHSWQGTEVDMAMSGGH